MAWNARELDELTVWADARQADGDGLGELVMLSLMADQQAARGQAEAAEGLRQRARELSLDLPDAALRAELGEGRAGLLATWKHGLLVALRIRDVDGRWPEAEALVARILRAPLARELRYLELDLRTRGRRALHHAVAEQLGDSRCVAQPRIVVLGPHPLRAGRRVSLIGPLIGPRVLSLETGPWAMFVDGCALRLPFASGGRRTRYRVLDAAAQRMFATKERSSRRDMAILSRGLFDPSMRVYKRALVKVAQHGPVAAALLPSALLELGDRARAGVRDAFASALEPSEALAEAVAGELMTSLWVYLDNSAGPWGLPFGEARAVLPRAVADLPGWRPLEARVGREAEARGLHGPGIDLNTCGRWSLERVEGLRPAVVDGILARRRERPFESIDELLELGLSPGALERVSDLLTVYRRLGPGLDPNAASDRQLRTLPGIGAAYAARIRANRPYTSVEELRRKTRLPAPTATKIARYMAWSC